MPTCYRHPDRETGLSCSECGRPICTECMTMAPVGIRCPEHAGAAARKPKLRGPRPVVRAQRQLTGGIAPVTRALIGLNVAVYLVTVVQGAGVNAPGGSLFDHFLLIGGRIFDPGTGHVYGGIAQGQWWRLITAAFLHANLIHIGVNMLSLWFIGAPVEHYLGRARFLALYLVSGIAGSAGALLQTTSYTVGASGAIFGVLGALLILEWQTTGRLAGNAMTWIVLNLALNFGYNGLGGNISIGGHIGGLIGGIIVTLSFAHWGRGHAAYGRIGLVGIAGLVAVTAASVAVAYFRVRGLA